MKKILALVTAKANSTRIAHKNKALLNGKPLYKWTTEFIESWRNIFFEDAIFSSDDPFSFLLYGGWIICRRPKVLILDETPHILSVKHGLEFAEKATGKTYDAVYLFQPTNPLRTQQILAHATALLDARNSDSQPYFSRCVYLDDNLQKKYICDAEWPKGKDGSPFIKSGTLYVYNRSYLLDGDCTKTKPQEVVMVIPKMFGYNINDRLDMRITEAIMKELEIPYGYESFYSGQYTKAD